MADKKYSGKSDSDSKSSNRRSKRSFTKDSPSSSKSEGRSSFKKDDSKPRRSSTDKDKPFSKFSKDDKFKKSDKPFAERKPYNRDPKTEKKRYGTEDKFKKDDGDKPKRSYDKSYFDKHSSDKKSYDKDSKPERKSYDRDDKPKRDDGDKPKRSYDKSYFDKNSGDKKPYDRDDKFKKDDDVKPRRSFDKDSSDRKPYKKDGDKASSFEKRKTYGDDKGEKRFKSEDFKEGRGFKTYDKDKKSSSDKPYKKRDSDYDKPKKHNDDGLIRLNKYLANAGISSRRDADTLILGGTVKVNGIVVDTLGYKVKPTDVVTYADSAIKNEKKVYLLLNKPKDFITTTDDPQERRTVMELVRPACKERIYPVGRLDRNTTGLLLFTNDGDIATKLMHPKHEIKKVYHVTINKPMRGEDYKAVGEGITLDDGPVKVDDIAFVGEGKKEIGLEIHSGKNRIVRRIFEHLGYEVLKLDRVSYAGLTKKDLPRGKYRFLTDKEISFLKMLG